MKKVGDLFAELGFRPDGSDSTKRAFIENLVKAAGMPRPQIVAKPAEITPPRGEQLSFNFSEQDGPETPFPTSSAGSSKKRSAG